MIVCPRCSKDNQDHYKFCLGCGTELPRHAQAPNDFRAPTPPAGMPAVEAADVALAATQAGSMPSPQPAAAAGPAAAQGRPCPSCDTPVPAGFKFCGSCGHRMDPSVPAPAAGSARQAPQAGAARGALVLINPDGSEGEQVPLSETETQVGREHGALFAGDSYMSPLHATFVFKKGALTVHDEGSLNGIYVKIDRDVPTPLGDGTMFRIGQEILRFEKLPEPQSQEGVELMGSPNPGYLGRVCLVVGRHRDAGNAFVVPAEGIFIGRERGDVLFPEDGYVSGLHCRVGPDKGGVTLTDAGSSNGTFIRVGSEQGLRAGDLLLMGQQLFRVSY